MNVVRIRVIGPAISVDFVKQLPERKRLVTIHTKFAQELSAVYHPLFTKAVIQLRPPLRWRGGGGPQHRVVLRGPLPGVRGPPAAAAGRGALSRRGAARAAARP